MVDPKYGTAEVQEPFSLEEKQRWDRNIERRNTAAKEVKYYARRHHLAREPRMAKIMLEEWLRNSASSI